jgi:hypothetical protein
MAKRTGKAALSLSLVVAAIGALALLAPVPPVAAGDRGPELTKVASGLSNPRGLAWVDGALYVAEAGKGGAGPCATHPELGELCLGRTGAVTRIWRGEQERVLRGLPSLADSSGFAATGPHDVSVGSSGDLNIPVGLAGDPQFRAQFGRGGRLLGHLVEGESDGGRDVLADLAAYEQRANPDGGAVDSNPYAVLGAPRGGGSRGADGGPGRDSIRVVVDAGGNDLLAVHGERHVRTLAVFPSRTVSFQGQQIPMQAVPTTVAKGRDGAYYVGELTGFPFPVGGARVYRVVPGHKAQIYARGFTNIIDIAFDASGRLYVLEIAHNGLLADQPFGALLRVNKDGSRTLLVDKGLFFPGGLVVRSPHTMYVTNCGICPDTGEVLRLQL